MPHDAPGRAARPAVLLALAVFSLLTVVGLAIVASPAWSGAEIHAIAWVQGVHGPVLDRAAVTIDAVFGDMGAVLVLGGAAVGIVVGSRSVRLAVRFGLVAGVPWVAAEVIKVVVQRPRPDAALLHAPLVAHPSSSSFPSGHTAFAAALVCAMLIVLAPRRGRAGWAVLGCVLVLATAWSRVYLGVHYPTDVAASMLVVPPVAVAVDRLAASWAMRPRALATVGS
ncbi:phosphatase PAP2 family protein [Demequina soli]|uniref:phosphatase PAP2 family protein n=1 Tax=Demequina soli TaxID=1638987 RepID=UPI000782A1EC|nr:phosphatase PAP2 family protein [Demequina soli]